MESEHESDPFGKIFIGWLYNLALFLPNHFLEDWQMKHRDYDPVESVYAQKNARPEEVVLPKSFEAALDSKLLNVWSMARSEEKVVRAHR